MLLVCSFAHAKESPARKKHEKNKVEKQELVKPVSLVDRLMLLDKNHDGLLSKKELEAFKPSPMFGPKLGPMPSNRLGYPMPRPKSNPWQGPYNMQFPNHWKR